MTFWCFSHSQQHKTDIVTLGKQETYLASTSRGTHLTNLGGPTCAAHLTLNQTSQISWASYSLCFSALIVRWDLSDCLWYSHVCPWDSSVTSHCLQTAPFPTSEWLWRWILPLFLLLTLSPVFRCSSKKLGEQLMHQRCPTARISSPAHSEPTWSQISSSPSSPLLKREETGL